MEGQRTGIEKLQKSTNNALNSVDSVVKLSYDVLSWRICEKDR